MLGGSGIGLSGGGGNREGRLPLTVLLRFWSVRFEFSSGREEGCATILCERPGIARGPPIMWGVEICGN